MQIFYKAVLVAALLPIAGCGGKVISSPYTNVATRFQSAVQPDGSGIAIECANSSQVQNADCMLWSDPKYKTPVRFLALRENQSYVTRLIRDTASKTGSKTDIERNLPASTSDQLELKRIAEGGVACFADEKMADLLVVCQTPERDKKTVVLFIRGLCDRCEFEPIVLRVEDKK